MNGASPSKTCALGCSDQVRCPLSQVKAGMAVRIKEFSGPPEVANRLRELGFCEDQHVRLVSCHSNLICQICNVRLGISKKLADIIWVEPVPSMPRMVA